MKVTNMPNQNPDFNKLVESLNTLFDVLGVAGLPPDTTEKTIVDQLDGIASTTPHPGRQTLFQKARMANRQQRRTGLPTDAEITRRLRAKGVDPRFMPRSDR